MYDVFTSNITSNTLITLNHSHGNRQTGVSPSLFSRMLGAKPPSSPTLVASFPYLALITFFRLW